jgi:hypothetical protein
MNDPESPSVFALITRQTFIAAQPVFVGEVVLVRPETLSDLIRYRKAEACPPPAPGTPVREFGELPSASVTIELQKPDLEADNEKIRRAQRPLLNV